MATTVDDRGEEKVTFPPMATSKQPMENIQKKLKELRKGNLAIMNTGEGKVTSQSTSKKLVQEMLAEMRAIGTNDTIRDLDKAYTAGASAMDTVLEGNTGTKSKEV
jgi:hypothetical protein